MLLPAAPLARGVKRPIENSERPVSPKRARVDDDIARIETFIKKMTRPISPFMKKWQLERNHIVGQGSWGKVVRAKEGYVAKIPQEGADALSEICKESLNLLRVNKEKTPFTPILEDVIFFKKEFALILPDAGPDLTVLYKEHLCDPWTGALFMKQLLECQAHLASLGLIHGDIKPNNICYDKAKRQIMLVDWSSLVTAPNRTLHHHTTRTFRAPEIFLRHSCTTKVDLWSIMCVMVSILTPEALLPITRHTPRLYIFHHIMTRVGPFSQKMIEESAPKIKESFFEMREEGWQLKSCPVTSLQPLTRFLEETKQNYINAVYLPLKEEAALFWDINIGAISQLAKLDPEVRSAASDILPLLTHSIIQAKSPLCEIHSSA